MSQCWRGVMSVLMRKSKTHECHVLCIENELKFQKLQITFFIYILDCSLMDRFCVPVGI